MLCSFLLSLFSVASFELSTFVTTTVDKAGYVLRILSMPDYLTNATRQTCQTASLIILTNNLLSEFGSILYNGKIHEFFLFPSVIIFNQVNLNHKKINSKDFYAFLIKKSERERERESCSSGSYKHGFNDRKMFFCLVGNVTGYPPSLPPSASPLL